jgi:hypothetical protein
MSARAAARLGWATFGFSVLAYAVALALNLRRAQPTELSETTGDLVFALTFLPYAGWVPASSPPAAATDGLAAVRLGAPGRAGILRLRVRRLRRHRRSRLRLALAQRAGHQLQPQLVLLARAEEPLGAAPKAVASGVLLGHLHPPARGRRTLPDAA